MSTATRGWREKLDYLARRSGRPDLDLVSEAIEAGITALYRESLSEAYLAGDLSRAEAIDELGLESVEELDYAISALESDVRWGLRRE